MPINPNKAFINRDQSPPLWKYDHFDYLPMLQSQSFTLIQAMQEKKIEWPRLCIMALGHHKYLYNLTRGEARSCLLTASVWENLNK